MSTPSIRPGDLVSTRLGGSGRLFQWLLRRLFQGAIPSRAWIALIRMLFGLTIRGTFAPQRASIFVGNHGSYFDGVFLATAIRVVSGKWPAILVWRGMNRYFVSRNLLLSAAVPFITLPETGDDVAGRSTAFLQVLQILRSGRSLCIFPEGEVRPTLGPFHLGAAFASFRTRAPVVPCTLRGVLPLWNTLPLPRRIYGHVGVQFHATVEPDTYRHLAPRVAAETMTAEIRARVSSTLDYPDKCAVPVPA